MKRKTTGKPVVFLYAVEPYKKEKEEGEAFLLFFLP